MAERDRSCSSRSLAITFANSQIAPSYALDTSDTISDKTDKMIIDVIDLTPLLLDTDVLFPQPRRARRIARPLTVKVVDQTPATHTLQYKRPRSDDEIDAPRKRQSLDEPMSQHQRQQKDKFEVTIDVTGYKPEELSVKVADGVLQVNANQEQQSEDGSYSLQSFCKKYKLPANSNLSEIKSSMIDDMKTLRVVVPLKVQRPKQQDIPIEICSDTPSQKDQPKA